LRQEEPTDPKKKAAKQAKRDEPLASSSSAGASSPTASRAPTTPTTMMSFRARLGRHVPMSIDIPVDVFADLLSLLAGRSGEKEVALVGHRLAFSTEHVRQGAVKG